MFLHHWNYNHKIFYCHYNPQYWDDLNWFDYGDARAWYAKIKSRPSFRQLLSDEVEGINPPAHYNNLDF